MTPRTRISNRWVPALGIFLLAPAFFASVLFFDSKRTNDFRVNPADRRSPFYQGYDSEGLGQQTILLNSTALSAGNTFTAIFSNTGFLPVSYRQCTNLTQLGGISTTFPATRLLSFAFPSPGDFTVYHIYRLFNGQEVTTTNYVHIGQGAPSLVFSLPTGTLRETNYFVTTTLSTGYAWVSTNGAAGPYGQLSGGVVSNWWVTKPISLFSFTESPYGNRSATNTAVYLKSNYFTLSPAASFVTNAPCTVTLSTPLTSAFVSLSGVSGPYASFLPPTTNLSIATNTDLAFYGLDASGQVCPTNTYNITWNATPPTLSVSLPSGTMRETNYYVGFSLPSGFAWLSTNSSVGPFNLLSGPTSTNCLVSTATTFWTFTENAIGSRSATNQANFFRNAFFTLSPSNSFTTNSACTVTIQTPLTNSFVSRNGSGGPFYPFTLPSTNLSITNAADINVYGLDPSGVVTPTNSLTVTWDSTAPVVTVSHTNNFQTNESFILSLSTGEDYGYWSTNSITGPYSSMNTSGTNISAIMNMNLWVYGRDTIGNNSTTNQYYYTVTNTNLTLWGKMESATSTIGPNFTTVGSVTYGPGVFGNGANLNSVNYFRVNSTNLFSPTEGTLSFWFTPTWDGTNVAGLYRTLLDSGTAVGEQRMFIAHDDMDLSRFNVFGTSANISPTEWETNFISGKPIHIAVTWKASGIGASGHTLKGFFNGRQVAFTNGLISNQTVFFDLYIGKHTSQTGAEGRFDNLKIYNFAKTNFADRSIE